MTSYYGPTRIPRVPVRRREFRERLLTKIRSLQTEVRPGYPGLVAYDLSAPARMIVPVITPFYNKVPRVRLTWRLRLQSFWWRTRYRITHRAKTILHACRGDYDDVGIWRG